MGEVWGVRRKGGMAAVPPAAASVVMRDGCARVREARRWRPGGERACAPSLSEGAASNAASSLATASSSTAVVARRCAVPGVSGADLGVRGVFGFSGVCGGAPPPPPGPGITAVL